MYYTDLEKEYERIMDYTWGIYLHETAKKTPDNLVVEYSNTVFKRMLDLKPKIFN